VNDEKDQFFELTTRSHNKCNNVNNIITLLNNILQNSRSIRHNKRQRLPILVKLKIGESLSFTVTNFSSSSPSYLNNIIIYNTISGLIFSDKICNF
jgi:hypothetical protein